MSDRNDFSYMLSTSFSDLPTTQVNWPFGSGEIQIRLSRWLSSWISDLN